MGQQTAARTEEAEPITFAKVLLFCTAEEKQTSRESSMKQYLNASSNYQGVYFHPDSKNEIQDLKQQIANLQSQFTRKAQKDSRKSLTKPSCQISNTSVVTKSAADTTTPQKPQFHNRDTNLNKKQWVENLVLLQMWRG